MNPFQGWTSMVQSLAAPILEFVKVRWLRTFIFACAAAVVIWFYGSFIRLGTWTPLAGDTERLYAVAAVFVGWLLYLVWWALVGRRRNKQLISSLTEGGIDSGAATAMEVEQVRHRLQQAMGQLRGLMGGRRGYLYELPWYILIGPPGSGKTTVLQNSGLKFPTAATMGRDSLRGVGGTRNCEWWITEQAILLDTAGRYTTQDSDPETDRGAWQGFLKLLKQYRPLQPINGVIVTLSVDDIATGTSADRMAHAQAIRSRIFELNQAFSSRFPIYVLLTKADLIAGFVEFFDALNRADREQVWGMTFPLDDGKVDAPPAAQRFEPEFDLLAGRLNSLMLERLQQEVDIERRGLVYGFPSQVVTLKEPLREFLAEVFATTRFDQRPLLRGVYLTSGTQSGVPIDRITQSMAAAFGMEVPRTSGFSGMVKAYFLTNLLSKVVFVEASLASVNTRLQRRRRIVQRVALAAAVLLVAGLGGLWGTAFLKNRQMVADFDRHLAGYGEAVAKLPTGPVSDNDFTQVVPPLNTLSDGFGVLHENGLPSWRLAGLNQSETLEGQYRDAYLRALDHLLLPRVLVDLQNRLRGRQSDPETVFEALKVYLSLGNQGPLDVAMVRRWMEAEWEAMYPGPDQTGLRADLNRHFAAMLARSLPTVALDGTLIDNARRVITQRSLPQRTYGLIRDSAAAQALPAWRPLDKTGALGQSVFTRLSGKPLNDGIPGFFTRRGYLEVLLPQMDRAIAQARTEDWVYGPNAPAGGSNDSLAQQIIALYHNDFETKWRTTLADLRVTQFRTVDQGVQVLNALSGPESTLKKLVGSVGDDTDLAPPPVEAKDDKGLSLPGLPKVGHPDWQMPPDSFQSLRETVRNPSGQFAEILRTVDLLYAQLSKIGGDAGNSPDGGAPSGSGVNEAADNLTSGARRLPAPVDNWMLSLASNAKAVNNKLTVEQINQLWAQSGKKLCQQAVSERYPFSHAATSAISLDDFDKLFAPGGVLDKFFNQNLKLRVNVSTHPWQSQATGTRPLNAAALAEFERAAAIREAFYGPNANKLAIEFEVTPGNLDSVSTGVVLDLAGQDVTYNHGPVRSTTVHWPAAGTRDSRVAFQPIAPNAAASFSGPWSPFRLFDTAELQPLGRDGSTATFTLGERSASFAVRSSSVLNPLRLPELREFHCPDVL